MGVSGVYKRMPTIKVRFVTEKDTYFIQTDTSQNKSDASILKDNSLVEQIISLNTENDMKNDTPIFSLVLAGLDDWDKILQPNDIVTIKIDPGDGIKPVNDVVMVGMVSEVKKLGNYSDNSIVYQITGQSMAKALMQLKLGTLQEIASITQGFGWMLNMGTTDQNGNSIQGNNNMPKGTLLGSAKAAAAQISGTLKDAKGKEFKVSSKDSIVLVRKGFGVKDGQWINVTGYGYAKAKIMDNLTQYELGMFGKKLDLVVNMKKSSEVKQYNEKYGNGVAVKTYDTKKDPTKVKAEKDKADAAAAGLETDESGLMFTGKTAAEVVENIMRWFFNLAGDDLSLQSTENDTVIKYTYNDERSTFGDWIELNLSSRSEDEMLLDQLPYLSFMGSLRQLITQAQAKPYNEFYIDFSSDEKAIFNMRPTPFEPDDWKELQGNPIVLYSNNVVEETLSRNDNEVYSVFSSSIPTSITLNSISDLNMYPVYFPHLAEQYGYSMLEQENDYIFRSKKSSNTDGGSDSSGSIDIGSGDAKTNAKNIANVLKKAGASGNAIAALLGNLQAESGVNPSRIQYDQKYDAARANGTGGAYAMGIAQWDYGRRANLMKYAKSKGKQWDNLGMQLSFLLDGDGSDSTLIKSILSSNGSISDLTYRITKEWERPGVVNDRSAAAKQWYSELNLSSVGSGKGKISTANIGIGNALQDALKKRTTTVTDLTGSKSPTVSHDTLKDAANLKGDNYTSISDQVAANEKKKKAKSAKAAKAQAKIDADNVNLAKKYSVYLANWYGNNNSFISGEIRVLGNPDYRPGTVLLRQDIKQNQQYEFYIESVAHEFSYTGGFTTVLGVTRGLPSGNGVNRFATWNSPDSPLTKDKPGNGELQLFTGGLFGEMSLGKLAEKGFSNSKDSDDSTDNDADGGESFGKGDDYPSKWKNATQDSLVDDWAYYNRECVSFVAWRLSQKKKWQGKSPTSVPFHGLHNAINWLDVRGTYGVSSPKAGDVAVFGNGVWGAQAYGHVAYVAKVKGDQIYIEDYNYGSPRGRYNTHTISKDIPTAYLRF